MKSFNGLHFPARCLLPLLVLTTILLIPANPGDAAMLYKDYVVRYDRGWDILCDPYQVRRGDWVLKIFRQKGEIAHEDFREFLGIFQRLNPHVRDIDRIRPGQVVDIPLKKLARGALPGQASGMVTIPFVMIHSPEKMIKKHSRNYVVKRGDTVSQLITKNFGGRYGNLTYSQGIKLFHAANPRIKDLNRIYVGQKINMPAPSIRQQNWYGAMFDEEGNLKNEMAAPKADQAEAPAPQPPAAAVPAVSPPAKPEEIVPAAEAASMAGGRLLNKGTYYLPMEQGREFELDLSRYPMIDMGNGTKVVLTTRDMVMNVDLPLIQSYWEDVKIVKVSENASSREILESMFTALSKDASANRLAFEDGAAAIQISARWIRTEAAGDGSTPRHTCITPIADASRKTHDSVVRYLDSQGIVLNEIISGPQPTAPPALPPMKVRSAGTIDGSSQKTLVQSFAQVMGFAYSPNAAISFPYAGIQVQAQSNLLSFGNGREVLVDFGDLYGDAVDAIRNTGLKILQIRADAQALEIIARVMAAAGMAHTIEPVFYAARRPAEFNTAITVRGVLIPASSGQSRLFTKTPLPEMIQAFIESRGHHLIFIHGQEM
jgi:hypothetical protein